MIKKLSIFMCAVFVLAISTYAPASAAKPQAGPAKPPVHGIDISYPQCGKVVPTDQAFGIVGVNGGSAATPNPCLSTQLTWASKSSGAVATQPKVQLYVNTANPGQVQSQMSTPWPTSNAGVVNNPHGTCIGENDKACSWEYGWGRADYSVKYFVSQVPAGMDASPAAYKWWLDVETMNSWQTGSTEALARNAAALEGWAAYIINQKATVALYSTGAQWKEIAGTVSSTSNLIGLQNWRPGGANLSTAKQACTAAPLTPGGKVVMTQYISRGIDYNHSCI